MKQKIKMIIQIGGHLLGMLIGGSHLDQTAILLAKKIIQLSMLVGRMHRHIVNGQEKDYQQKLNLSMPLEEVN